MNLKQEQTILFKYKSYGLITIFEGNILYLKKNTVHVSFVLRNRPIHIDISKEDIIAVYDKNQPVNEIGEHKGRFLKIS